MAQMPCFVRLIVGSRDIDGIHVWQNLKALDFYAKYPLHIGKETIFWCWHIGDDAVQVFTFDGNAPFSKKMKIRQQMRLAQREPKKRCQ